MLAQQPAVTQPPAQRSGPNHEMDALMKAVDDVAWHLKLGDIAAVDKVSFTSLPAARESNPTAQGAGNPLIIRAYTFMCYRLTTFSIRAESASSDGVTAE